MRDKLANNIWMSKKYIYETCLQLVLGLKAIHNKNVLHLDIKPANLLLGLDLKWKYTDLGVSKNVDDERDHTVNLKGITACYSSPEQYQLYQFQSNKKITKQCDIYSLGVVFMELTGVDIRKKWVIKQKIRQKPFDKYLNPDFQEFNEAVLKNMLQYNPNQRIQIEELEIILKNLISGENKQNDSSECTTQDDATRKSVVFLVEESSPSKRVKSIHKKSFSVSEEKNLENNQAHQSSNNPSQIYQLQKQSNQSPSKKIIIPIEKIQQYNYSNNSGESPENSPLKKRATKIIHRQVGGSKTPVQFKQSENIYMSGMSLTPNKQRNSNQIVHEQQEIYAKQTFNPSRRAVSMHQNQELLPPIQGINRIQQMNNNAYNNTPSPISFMKRSFLQQQQTNIPINMVNSQIIQNSSSQSPMNKNRKASSKSFSQKIIIPKKLIPGSFNGMIMAKNQFDQQYLVSN